MIFKQADKLIDFGKNFAQKNSPDFNTLYHKYNAVFLKLLTDVIGKSQSIIADYGGGNGIIAKKLSSTLKAEKKNCIIEIIDIDQTKFFSKKNIRFINADVLKYKNKGYYDYSLSRFLLHYFNKNELKKFIKNVYDNLRPSSYFLLINWVIDEPETYKKKKQILDIIEKEKKINHRTIPTTSIIVDVCKNSGFSIISKKKFTYKIKINDFYKNRFNLSADIIKKIIKQTKIKSHKESQIGLLLEKIA